MYKEKALLHGYKYFGKGEMISVNKYSCSNCGASDRERLYSYWINQKLQDKTIKKDSRIIHFAPETALSDKFKKQLFTNYYTADLHMKNVDFNVDLHKLPFDDNSYDFFICSHVLEHVKNDKKAIQEIFRVTDKKGLGIFVAPIIPDLKETIEDPTIVKPEDRWRLYGQDDHVRLYSHDDFVNKITNSGFKLLQLDINHFGKKVFNSLGLKKSSILYIAIK